MLCNSQPSNLCSSKSHPVSLFRFKIVTICSIKLLLYVASNCYYLQHQIVTICSIKLLLYVASNCYYLQHQIVTICSIKLLLYVASNSYYLQHQIVTICSIKLKIRQLCARVSCCRYCIRRTCHTDSQRRHMDSATCP